jgi:hypothetical protein
LKEPERKAKSIEEIKKCKEGLVPDGDESLPVLLK